jgi:hypothetical protein
MRHNRPVVLPREWAFVDDNTKLQKKGLGTCLFIYFHSLMIYMMPLSVAKTI